MKRILVGTALALALVGSSGLVGSTGIASAQERSPRACVGAFVSEAAKTFHPLGAGVRELAQAPGPFGAEVSEFARTCEFPG